jgi:hypothetical protein
MRFLLLFTLISFWITPVSAAVPTQLHYNGYLTNELGEAVDCPDPIQCAIQYILVFRLYDQESEGSLLWEETHVDTAFYGGSFHLVLGDSTPISPASLDSPVWVGIAVNDNGEMSPRQRVVSAAFALRAGSAEQADEAANATQLGGMAATDYASAATLNEVQGNLAPVATTGSFDDLVDVPSGLADGDDDTQLGTVEVQNIVSGTGYVPGPHTVDTTLSEAEIDAYVANNGYLTAADLPPAIPSGMIGFFGGECPPGWADLSANFGGRALVLAPEAGTAGESSKTGAALGDLENRSVIHEHTTEAHTHPGASHTHAGPSHTHSSAAHTHNLSIQNDGQGYTNRYNFYNLAATSTQASGAGTTDSASGTTGSGGGSATGSSGGTPTGIAGLVTSDLMPYIQLKACQAP